MTFIRTICDDIAPADLGACYSHEHVLCSPPPDVTDRDLELDSEAAATQELTWFKQAGGCALVDMTPADYGRDAEGMLRISKATGIHIIAATGLHNEKYSGRIVKDKSIDELADRFARDALEGVDGTDIKAGVIKAASSLNTITVNEEKVFRAAARAHHATGAVISTHTEVGTMGLEQIQLLISEGVEPERIIIGHVDRKLEWGYHLTLWKTGVTLSYDQISKEKYAPDSQRVEFILRAVEAGFGKQIVLGGDLARKSYLPAYGTGGGPGLTYILWRFIPWLRSAGLSEEALQDLLVHNLARVLALS
jgi:5-phospho-D-xylono-1,4-lactonase